MHMLVMVYIMCVAFAGRPVSCREKCCTYSRSKKMIWMVMAKDGEAELPKKYTLFIS